MKKFALCAAFVCLTPFVAGCDNSPAAKDAKAEKNIVNEEKRELDAAVDAEAKQEKADIDEAAKEEKDDINAAAKDADADINAEKNAAEGK